MSWISKHLELTAPHFTYLIVSGFLIIYALFSHFIRNRLHLSEPPLATLVGIAFGPKGVGVLDPQGWGFEDNITQEAARVIVGVQVFTAAIQLPQGYFLKHWDSVGMMLGPVMSFSWLVTAAFASLVLQVPFATGLIISACLAPTDPVLAASVLAESRFSSRIPKRLRNMLSAESASNDGVSFPFLYVGIDAVLERSAGLAIQEWLLSTILWQCMLGTLIGLVIGYVSNRALRFANENTYIAFPAFFVFYFLLAVFSIGVSSLIDVDDFLVAFGAGIGFASDGWFVHKTHETHLPETIDLLLNSAMFVYFGAIIPWEQFTPSFETPTLNPGRLIGFLVLVILFRRIPIVLALKRWIPDIKTYREALFCGHFGPMGLGALFLVIEARAELESNKPVPLPHLPDQSPYLKMIETIWPVVCFIILGSIMIHGLSVAAIQVVSHFMIPEEERVPLIGSQTDPLSSMIHDESSGHSVSDDDSTG